MNKKATKQLSADALAYLAGIVDGEGCLTLNFKKPGPKSGRRGCHRIVVHVSNTNKAVIEHILRVTGIGRVHPFVAETDRNRKARWQWAAWSNQAIEFLKLIQPWLIVKKEQCRLLIEFSKLLKNQAKNYLSEAEWQAQTAICSQIRLLNRKGIL